MPIELGYLLPTREQIMSGRPETAGMLSLAERAEHLGFGGVWIGDEFVNDKHPKDRDIAMVFQNYALFDKSVGDNIAFPLRRLFDNISEEEIAERVAERLMRMSLPGFEGRNPSSLSGGQKKRIGVARATVIRAPYILYDEPTSELDPLVACTIGREIVNLRKRTGATSIVVTHDRELACGIADRIVLCCPALVSPSVGGIIGNQVRRLTLDPGARRLAASVRTRTRAS